MGEEKGLAFLRQYHPTFFPALLDDSRFNRRRRDLLAAMEALCCHFHDAWREAHPQDSIDNQVWEDGEYLHTNRAKTSR